MESGNDKMSRVDWGSNQTRPHGTTDILITIAILLWVQLLRSMYFDLQLKV